MTQFIHEFDLLLHIFGPAVEVSATLDTHLVGIESEDTFAATIRFDNGATVVCSCTSAGQRHTSVLDVFGEHASVHRPWRLDCHDHRLQAHLLREAIRAVPAPKPARSRHRFVRLALGGMRKLGLIRPAVRTSSHTAYIGAVLDAIDAGRALPTPPPIAKASVELCTAVYAAGITGRSVTLPLNSTCPTYAGVSVVEYQQRQRSRTPA